MSLAAARHRSAISRLPVDELLQIARGVAQVDAAVRRYREAA
jgi:hypothetical protein